MASSTGSWAELTARLSFQRGSGEYTRSDYPKEPSDACTSLQELQTLKIGNIQDPDLQDAEEQEMLAIRDQERLANQRAGMLSGKMWKTWMMKCDEWWIFELAASIVSLSCFCTLVAVLATSSNKTQSLWFNGWLTLNGLVALLATFIKASMAVALAAALGQLKWNRVSKFSIQGRKGRRIEEFDAFDQASRGPYGSLKLLFLSNGLHLGLLGAVIVVLSLSFDVFAQNVIAIKARNVPDVRGTSSLEASRSEIYNDSALVSIATDGGVTFLDVDQPFKMAIAAGIFQSGNISPPAAQCTTGNCSWPITPSIAVCGSCTNATNSITGTCTNSTNEDDANLIDVNCNYTVAESDGYEFISTYSYNRSDQQFFISPNSGYLSFSLQQLFPQGNDVNPNIPRTILRMYDFIVINASIVGTIPQVQKCGLWACLQAYYTEVRAGVQTQTIVANWSDGVTREGGSFFFDGMREEQFNVTTDTSYGFGNNAVSAFLFTDNTKLDPLFNGNVSVWDNTDDPYGPKYHQYSSLTAEALYSVTDWQGWIDKVALSITNHLRSAGTISAGNENRFPGVVYSMVSYVHVRWAWLALPAALVAGSAVFLTATIWQTSRQRISIRKTSAIPLLLALPEQDLASSSWRNADKERIWFDDSQGNAFFRRAE